MKKRILAILLSGLMLINVSACNINDINKETTTELEKDPPSIEDPINKTTDPSELDYFACEQIGGYNTFRDYSKTHDAEVFFGYDPSGQCYTHVPAWNAYFQVSIPKWEVPTDALISGDYLFIISATPEGDRVTTYKFSKDGNLIESYSNEFPLSYSTHDFEEAWLYNWYQENLLYASFLENTMETSEYVEYVLHKFQSTDYGKTWIEVEGEQLEFVYYNIEVFKMFTNDHGIITSQSGGKGDIYVTHNGGGTWNLLELPYPAEWGKLEGFHMKSITYTNNEYSMVLFPFSKNSPSQEITFLSKDFVSWEMQDLDLLNQ